MRKFTLEKQETKPPIHWEIRRPIGKRHIQLVADGTVVLYIGELSGGLFLNPGLPKSLELRLDEGGYLIPNKVV